MLCFDMFICFWFEFSMAFVTNSKHGLWEKCISGSLVFNIVFVTNSFKYTILKVKVGSPMSFNVQTNLFWNFAQMWVQNAFNWPVRTSDVPFSIVNKDLIMILCISFTKLMWSCAAGFTMTIALGKPKAANSMNHFIRARVCVCACVKPFFHREAFLRFQLHQRHNVMLRNLPLPSSGNSVCTFITFYPK